MVEVDNGLDAQIEHYTGILQDLKQQKYNKIAEKRKRIENEFSVFMQNTYNVDINKDLKLQEWVYLLADRLSLFKDIEDVE